MISAALTIPPNNRRQSTIHLGAKTTIASRRILSSITDNVLVPLSLNMRTSPLLNLRITG